MSQVFADTSFYQAFFNKRDRWHFEAKRLVEALESGIVTTDYILVELGALMARGEARALYIRFVDQVRADPDTELIAASRDLFNQGLALFAARLDKGWSLTDCISFAVMRERGLVQALTSDHHFEQAGFACLLLN